MHPETALHPKIISTLCVRRATINNHAIISQGATQQKPITTLQADSCRFAQNMLRNFEMVQIMFY